MVKLEWDTKEQKFNSYFDILKKQYSPDASDLKYISSMLERDIHITDKTTPKDVARVLMTKDEFDFTSTYSLWHPKDGSAGRTSAKAHCSFG